MSLFRMPSLGSDMERAVLTEWLVEPGTEVRRGDLIAVVETDKGAIEIEVFEDGQLTRQLVDVDTEVAVGEPLAEITRAGEQSEPEIAPPPETPAQSRPLDEAPIRGDTAPPQPAMPVSEPGRRVSPAARRLAHEHGLDISAVSGSGADGAVTYDDVHALLNAAPVQPPALAPAPAAATDRQANMRRAIAAAMARSKREIPHYYLGSTVDIEPAMIWLTKTNASRPPAERILASAVLIKATALALRRFPEFNGFHEDGVYRPAERINVGVGIAIRGGGLVAPAIHDTEQIALDDLMAHLRDLTQRVRAGRYRASEFRDPTVTITSLGDRGVDQVYGVIYPPQVACIGFGRIVDQPRSLPDRSVASRRTVHISLAADHRVSDGRSGSALINTIAGLLQKPEQL